MNFPLVTYIIIIVFPEHLPISRIEVDEDKFNENKQDFFCLYLLELNLCNEG